MSDGTKRPYEQVARIANGLVERLTPVCERIEIAGSLRRKNAMVGDIELVVIPRFRTEEIDLFGTTQAFSELDELLNGWMDTGHIHHGPAKRWGDKLKAFTFATTTWDVYKVDLFIQPDPATWGVNFLIRTGSWEFSRYMVTPKRMGGAMPDGYQVRDARVWRDGKTIETPEERDVWHLWGMDWIEPEKRNGIPVSA